MRGNSLVFIYRNKTDKSFKCQFLCLRTATAFSEQTSNAEQLDEVWLMLCVCSSMRVFDVTYRRSCPFFDYVNSLTESTRTTKSLGLADASLCTVWSKCTHRHSLPPLSASLALPISLSQLKSVSDTEPRYFNSVQVNFRLLLNSSSQ